MTFFSGCLFAAVTFLPFFLSDLPSTVFKIMPSSIPNEDSDDEYDISQRRPPPSRKRTRTLVSTLEQSRKKKYYFIFNHAFCINLYRSSPLVPFLKVARWIGRSQDPFINFFAVFQAQSDMENEDDGDSEYEEPVW